MLLWEDKGEAEGADGRAAEAAVAEVPSNENGVRLGRRCGIAVSETVILLALPHRLC